MQRIYWALALAVVVSAAAAGTAAFAKPLRLAAPHLFGLHCADRVCTEDSDRLAEAQRLVGATKAEIEQVQGWPLPGLSIVLCSTPACYRSFGGGDERAMPYPLLGTIVAGQSWQDYIIRHELIHWLQFDRFGAFETMSHPAWFREGMAYALSEAPEWDIPPHFRPWAAQYAHWQGQRTPAEIWREPPTLK